MQRLGNGVGSRQKAEGSQQSAVSSEQRTSKFSNLKKQIEFFTFYSLNSTFYIIERNLEFRMINLEFKIKNKNGPIFEFA